MQLTISADNPLEWVALRANLVPVPLLHAQVMPVISKAVLEAADKGVFDAAADGHETAEAVAQACQLNPKATRELLGLLTALGYFTYNAGRFTLTKMARKWTLKHEPESVYGMMLFNNRVVWPWLEKLGNYLQTGEGIHYHDHLDAEGWNYYQQAMVAASGSEAKEFGRRAPVSKAMKAGQPVQMLDIGGSHGQHSVALCKRYAGLTSRILDLPAAIEQAAPLLARLGMGERVQHVPGNALTDDFGEAQYDFVLMSSLAHHFTPEQNADVARRVARALKPGGIYIINEFIRPEPDAAPELVGSSTDLFYGLTSTAGNYSISEIQAWQRDAGLRVGKVVTYRTLPGRAMVVGNK
ncbi:class I SAM-dependent methyltransferase [Fibrella aquatilis]|uniref:Class I SAM-dependent methyltransferase n=1 Tax=Fibrella aquatilis TaxID=2817059 RepID=A0A939G5N9_9BACT|nr:class I SAM-dependent methyltransferase [Fibrella aquatilis]MBO0930885.1 class I SAM-dependent methyltransferase [Fibrella aquatilis]